MDSTYSENWTGDLEAGEQMVRQGRPAGRFVWPMILKVLVLMPGVFALMGLRWLMEDIQTGSSKWMGRAAFAESKTGRGFLRCYTLFKNNCNRRNEQEQT